ncbi:MAG: CocE/NonD family hydrolase [Nocardioidaceae bacterium]
MSVATDSRISQVDASSEHEVRLRMDDGVELAATVYLPGRAAGPQPCILEALPYRKDDLTCGYASEYVRLRDEHQYAVCRLDLRGTGSSGGRAVDEYPEEEQRDLLAVIEWLADQDWCNGAVGMYGTSYSGFNSLQMACERPPALKAICAIYATDDRYTDDVHWRGGALRMIDLVDYCHYMTPMNALPPVPARWGDGWRDEWRDRIDALEPWLLRWLNESLDGGYWRHGSVHPGYDRIECAVMLVVGWADGYRNNSFRTAAALREAGVPHRVLAGPWAHASTSSAAPGPRIDLVPEMVAWWDRWLRGIDNGVDDGLTGPALTAFVRRSTRPEPDLDTYEGSWWREEWPTARVSTRSLLLDSDVPDTAVEYAVRADTGVSAWIDCAGHLPWGQSGDQRFDDAASLRWEWEADEVTVLGQPSAHLRISADRPTASLSVKLCDVFADDTSALVTRGSLDLAYHEGLDEAKPLDPGTVYDVVVELDACAYSFDPGHRLRLSLAGADWPNTVAPPEPVTLTVHGGELRLPVHQGKPAYDPPRLTPGDEHSSEDVTGISWKVVRDVLQRETSCEVDHGSTYDIPFAGVATEHYWGRVGVNTRDFTQHAEAEVTFTLSWPEATVVTRSRMDISIDHAGYEVMIDLQARDGDDVVAERRWHQLVPRRRQPSDSPR